MQGGFPPVGKASRESPTAQSLGANIGKLPLKAPICSIVTQRVALTEGHFPGRSLRIMMQVQHQPGGA